VLGSANEASRFKIIGRHKTRETNDYVPIFYLQLSKDWAVPLMIIGIVPNPYIYCLSPKGITNGCCRYFRKSKYTLASTLYN